MFRYVFRAFLIYLYWMSNTIKKLLRESLIIESSNEVWYHGTPDVRELEKEGGFTAKSTNVDYISDMPKFRELENLLDNARTSGNNDEYNRLIKEVPKLKNTFTLRKPIFLTNVNSVARTYANASRSMDYQGAIEKVLKVSVSLGNSITIVAINDSFRFIDIDKVKRGFVNAGVNEKDFDETVERFTFYQQNNKVLKTDTIAVIGEWFKFDYIDVVGVLDSYQGGTTKSTVRMVFDPNSIKIIQ
jgi:hypothetical protein